MTYDTKIWQISSWLPYIVSTKRRFLEIPTRTEENGILSLLVREKKVQAVTSLESNNHADFSLNYRL